MTGYKHGFARPGQRSPEYRSWEAARSRCRNPNDPSFARYGGRGITFTPEWDRFEDFLADMGPRPKGTTLDRIDGDGDYEPTNCRWATDEVQSGNRASIRRYEWQGQSLHLRELARLTGVPYQRLNERIVRHGWTIERAVTEPPRRW